MKTNYIIFSKVKLAKLLLLIGINFISNVYAQNAISMQSPSETKVKSSVWKLLASNEFIDVNYKYEECTIPSQGTHDENVYLQIKNKTAQAITVEWNTEYWYNNKCYGCEDGNTENHKTIYLAPNATIEGVCAKNANPALVILSKMLNVKTGSELTNFNLRDIKTTVNK